MEPKQAILMGLMLGVVFGGLGYIGFLDRRPVRAGLTVLVFVFLIDLLQVEIDALKLLVIQALIAITEYAWGLAANELGAYRGRRFTVTGSQPEERPGAGVDRLADLFDVMEVDV